MAQSTTYDIVGKKEDISNVISNISPTKYPFSTMTGAETCKAVLFQWQEDSLRAAAVNAQTEGFTATATARAATTMRNNVTQIFQDTYAIAATTDAVSTYGRAKESAYQTAKAAESLKADLEYCFVGADSTPTGLPSDNTTARLMAGVQHQIDSTHIVKTGAAGTALSEANLLTALQTAYKDGADPSVIMVTPARSMTVAAFASASGRTRQIPNGGKDKAIVNVVDLYVSPFGEQKVVLNRLIKHVAADDTGADTLVFDPKNWKKVTLRPWMRETLAKVGDATTMMIVGEFSLKHLNQKASSLIRESA